MKTIAVIFGGRSAEHDVSIITALASVIKPLELSKQYRVEAVYIAKDGTWYWDEKLKDIKLFSSGDVESFMHKAQPASVQFDGGMTLVKSSGIAGRKTVRKIDVAFPAMHGTYGEDGSLMGLLEMANVPYVGCDLFSSALVMDKVTARLVAEANGIKSPKMKFFTKAEFTHDPGKILETINKSLKYPLFVKPARLGSSIGITQVHEEKSLLQAIEVAAHYDSKIVVEEAVQNLIEVTLPILGNKELTPAYLEQPLLKPEDFFDFESKYMGQGKKMGAKMGGKQGAQGYSKIPADLPEDLYKKAEETGLKTYRALGCEGTARVDMLIDSKTKQIYFNEVNPLPGSLYAHNWRQRGVSNVELVSRLVELAESRFKDRQTLSTVFATNFLKQF